MTSEVSLCNRALSEIGTRTTISSIAPSDGSNEANQCALLYYPVRDALLRAVHWDFARAQANLTQVKSVYDINSTCPVPWAYEYAYPSDCKKMRFILPNLNFPPTAVPLTTGPNPYVQGCFGFNKPVRFLVATDKDNTNNDTTVILTNQAQAIGVYTRWITNPDLFDDMFQEALVQALSAHLVPALNMNLSLMNIQIKKAQAIIDQARVTNGNEGPMVQDTYPDWLQVRGGPGTYGFGYFFLGWDQMAWPTGL